MADSNPMQIHDIADLEPAVAAEGTYTPVTDGWAVGFRFEQKGKPAQYIMLNPSSEDDAGQANVFLYTGDHDLIENMSPQAYFNIGEPAAPTASTDDAKVIEDVGDDGA